MSWLWAVLALGWAPGAAHAGELLLQPGRATVAVDRGVEVLIEQPGENLTPDSVLASALAGRWQAYPRPKINLPGERRPVWVRFDVRPQAGVAADWVLGIEWPLLDKVDFHPYDPGAGRWLPGGQGGLDRPASSRTLKDTALSFPLTLTPGQRTTVLLRVHTHTQLSLPLQLSQARAWQARRYDYGVAMGLLFGILGVMFLYNLSLYVFTRESSFRTYAGYLLSIVAYELAVTGVGPLYLWGGNAWMKARGYEFFATTSFLAATIFFRRFLKLRNEAPHLNRLNQGLLVFWVVMSVLTAFPSPVWLVHTVTLGGIFVGFAAVYTAGYLVWQGNVLARYFLIAWIAIISATFVTLLSLMGAIEGGAWIDQSQHLGFVIETVLLSMALAERIKRERRSKEAAQLEALELAREVDLERDEKLRAQEHALTVQREANEALELRVLDRTGELKRTMENLELANRELAKLSVTDALTKVHNRRYFDDTLRKEYDRSARAGSPLALLLADIDFFKSINDSVGHLAGDECLKLVANALAGCVGRSTDLVARYGGEEFAVVLPATDESQAVEIAQRLRCAVEDIQFIYRGQRVPITVSLGVVARVADPDRPLADFIHQADQALYAAKNAGRNRVMLADAA